MWRRGDLVSRKSYGDDIIFKVESIQREMAILRGIEVRLLADARLSDLTMADEHLYHRENIVENTRATEEKRLHEFYREVKRIQADQHHTSEDDLPFFELPGRILHLDGDAAYLRKSMEVYGRLNIPAEGHYVRESMMPDAVYQLLPSVRPDILIITGHDGLIRTRAGYDKSYIGSYKNSQNFVNAVVAARHYERNRDSLTIIAGACQSHFEALLQAGANFASSPARILIHALDPVYIAAKMAYTTIKGTINIYEVIRHTVSGVDGIGGIETRGSYRIGLPKSKDVNKM
ncbi:MAG: sporulation peptidase YabG [Paenibacillaceae bacterium]